MLIIEDTIGIFYNLLIFKSSRMQMLRTTSSLYADTMTLSSTIPPVTILSQNQDFETSIEN